MFQKLWTMLLLSFYPPFKVASCSSTVLEMSSQIFPLLTYVVSNVHSDESNILPFEVECDHEEDPVEVYAKAESESLRQGAAKAVS